MGVLQLTSKCWHLLREGTDYRINRNLLLEVPGRESFNTFEPLHRYERIITLLSEDPQRYFEEISPPSILPMQVIQRPFSTLIKCQVRTTQRNFCIYIKFIHIKNDSTEYHARIIKRMKNDFFITTKLYDLLKENSSYAVPRIIAFFPEEMALITEESDGKTLLSLLRKKGKGYPKQRVMDELEQYCQTLGGWLQTFQNLTRITSSQSWDEAEFINYINLRLSKLEKSWLCIRQEDTYRIQRYLEQLLQQATEDKKFLCGVHGDIGLSNILVSSKKITVLDFPMYKIGSFYDDLTYIFMRIEYLLFNPLFRISVITKLQNAFLEGYKNEFDRKNSLFMAYCMKHRVNRLVDLSKVDNLSMVKKIYQIQQFKRFLNKINKNIETQSY
jgi:hypothetical protein